MKAKLTRHFELIHSEIVGKNWPLQKKRYLSFDNGFSRVELEQMWLKINDPQINEEHCVLGKLHVLSLYSTQFFLGKVKLQYDLAEAKILLQMPGATNNDKKIAREIILEGENKVKALDKLIEERKEEGVRLLAEAFGIDLEKEEQREREAERAKAQAQNHQANLPVYGKHTQRITKQHIATHPHQNESCCRIL